MLLSSFLECPEAASLQVDLLFLSFLLPVNQNKIHFNVESQHDVSGAPVKSHIVPTHSY